MLKHARSIVAALARRFRNRAVLELENLALRHQLQVLRRQRPGRPQLIAIDGLLWVWFYRLWPRCLETMVLVKPATIVQWHRQGFRLFWRWRSRSGRPSADREIRKLIREMSGANPLWGAPRIHGELLKLGIELSQATVAKYMVRRRGTPSPTWRSFLRNQAAGVAAIDMFVVASASFRLLYVIIILTHDRRKIARFDVIRNPTTSWLARQVTEAVPWDPR
jgi:putative transposase